jgi:low temperature requirement protein LtrA
MVRVSARARTTQEATQLGGAVILPLIFLALGQASGLLLVDISVAIAIGAVTWALALWLVWRGASRFTRDRLATTV